MSKPGGYIYAIGAVGTSYVKIGRTTGPVLQRLQTLQTGQPFPLQVLASVPVETDAHRIEKQVHTFLEAERRRGEWFDVPMDMATLEALILRAVAYLAAEEDVEDDADHPLRQMLGQRIRQAREQAQMSQVELARCIGISANALCSIETGETDPRVSRVVAIARELHMSLDALVGIDLPP